MGLYPSKAFTERGSGLVGSFFGAIVFLAFLTLATHTLISLYATSILTAVAWDDTRMVAESPNDSAVVASAESHLRNQLSGLDDLTIEWHTQGDAVGLTVSAERPMLLPRALASSTGFDRIERTVWMRNEELR